MTNEQYNDIIWKLIMDSQSVCEGISTLEGYGKYKQKIKMLGNKFYNELYTQLVEPQTTKKEDAQYLFKVMELNNFYYQAIKKKGFGVVINVLQDLVNDNVMTIDEKKHSNIIEQLETV